MRTASPAGRMLLVCAVVLLASQFAPVLADSVLALWREFGPDWCTQTDFAAQQNPCILLWRRPSLVTGLALTPVLLGFLGGCAVAVRWCLRPVRDLVPVIEKVGPQNLGHRLRPGAGRGELTVLGRTIDDMMDRIAVGYEAQRRFAADASHELRTPLAVQRTLIEIGLAGNRSGEQLALVTEQLMDTNIRNERLIEGLLVLSESDRGLMSRTPLRLDEIAGQVLEGHRARAAEPALTVVNTGDDIPPDAVTALFEPFHRLSGVRIDHSGGAGLGLSIARSITRAHDGTIAATSTGQDGLRIDVRFPGAP